MQTLEAYSERVRTIGFADISATEIKQIGEMRAGRDPLAARSSTSAWKRLFTAIPRSYVCLLNPHVPRSSRPRVH